MEEMDKHIIGFHFSKHNDYGKKLNAMLTEEVKAAEEHGKEAECRNVS